MNRYRTREEAHKDPLYLLDYSVKQVISHACREAIMSLSEKAKNLRAAADHGEFAFATPEAMRAIADGYEADMQVFRDINDRMDGDFYEELEGDEG